MGDGLLLACIHTDDFFLSLSFSFLMSIYYRFSVPNVHDRINQVLDELCK